MDLVYTLGPGSNWDNNEIRYSLRSVEKYLNIDRVFIIGEACEFLKDVTYIPLIQQTRSAHQKQFNIYVKIVKACYAADISENFIHIDDDHFFLRPVKEINYYHCGNLYKSWDFNPMPSYRQTLMNTYNELIRRGLPTLDFNIHCPIVYNKKLFLEKVCKFPWNMYHGFTLQSLYCNSLKIEGQCGVDCKVRTPYCIDDLREITAFKDLFSVGDDGLNDSMKNYLQELYPEPSRWEALF